MNRNRTTLILAVLILLAGAAVGAADGLLSARADDGGDAWPVVCAVEGDATTCVMATITPVVWGEATAAAVATWEAGRQAPAPAP